MRFSGEFMKKVIIIGCPGSGKSTFARSLQEKTNLSLYYLDMLYWNADKTTVPKDIFLERLKNIISDDEWIIDGNYGSSMELRMKECDTVFFLDFDVDVCIHGVRDRMGKTRPDMPWIETEEDEEFIEFIKNYNSESRPKVLELLNKYNNKNIIIFKNREASAQYLKEIKV